MINQRDLSLHNTLAPRDDKIPDKIPAQLLHGIIFEGSLKTIDCVHHVKRKFETRTGQLPDLWDIDLKIQFFPICPTVHSVIFPLSITVSLLAFTPISSSSVFIWPILCSSELNF